MPQAFRTVAEGIGAQSNAAIASQVANGSLVIFLIGSAMGLQQAWMAKIQEDALKYFLDTINVADPNASMKAAADAQQKTMDTAQADQETGQQNTLIETLKSGAQIAASGMDLVFSL